MKYLYDFLGLGLRTDDVVFVSVDFENPQNGNNLEAGIATLDSDNLDLLKPSPIETYNGIAEDRKVKKAFLFGATCYMMVKEFRQFV